MSRALTVVALLLSLVACGDDSVPPAGEVATGAGTIEVTSPAFDDGGSIPVEHTCDGQDTPPPLDWSGVPEDAQELALLLEDPDAPGGVFVHWVLAGLEPTSEGLERPEVPAGAVEGTNDRDRRGYAGPCPPEGDEPHRYVFTVFAADQALGLEEGASAADLQEALEGHTLARGQLTGTYGR